MFLKDHSSVEHGPNFVIEGLIVEIIDFDGLEVFFRIEVSLGNQEGLPKDQFLDYLESYFDFGVVVVHDIVVDITFVLFVDFEEIGDLVGG